MNDRSLITDDPRHTGMLDGGKAIAENSRISREKYLPESQKSEYRKGFRLIVKDLFCGRAL